MTIDWDILVDRLTLSKPVKTLFKTFLKVLLEPFKTGYTAKLLWMYDVRYKLSHTNQVIYLEKVLNEYYEVAGYDPTDHENTKGIYIDDGDKIPINYMYQPEEDKPLYVEAPGLEYFMYTPQEISASFTHFTVMVPVALSYEEVEMRGVIDYYTNTKRYTIETY